MPRIQDLNSIPRKDLHIFYVLDTSGSMFGTKISTLNHALEETINILATLAQSNGDAQLKIAAMEFNSGANWITRNGPEDVEDFVFHYLDSGGLTDIGAALDELNSKLSRNAYLNSVNGALMPIIIFMTDGHATDQWERALQDIRNNKWFQRATKIGFALGDDADEAMIASIVGNREAVIKTSDYDVFAKLIRFVSVTASVLGSTMNTTNSFLSSRDLVQEAIKQSGISDDVIPTISDDEYYADPGYNTDFDTAETMWLNEGWD